mgnify:CR=1 FL=1
MDNLEHEAAIEILTHYLTTKSLSVKKRFFNYAFYPIKEFLLDLLDILKQDLEIYIIGSLVNCTKVFHMVSYQKPLPVSDVDIKIVTKPAEVRSIGKVLTSKDVENLRKRLFNTTGIRIEFFVSSKKPPYGLRLENSTSISDLYKRLSKLHSKRNVQEFLSKIFKSSIKVSPESISSARERPPPDLGFRI